jgi:translocation and assembly module TamA
MASPAARNNITSSISRLALSAAVVLTLAGPFAATRSDAQDRDADPELEAMIPDAALDNPEEWSKGAPSQPANVAQPVNVAPELDPNSPLAELPGFSLPWPEDAELPELVSLEPDPDVAQTLAEMEQLSAAPQGEVAQISKHLSLVFPSDLAAFPDRVPFEARFRELSTLEQLGDNDDTIAQLSVRARTDRDLLQRLLRDYGYYDGSVTQTVSGSEPDKEANVHAVNVRFDIVPGERYHFGALDFGKLPDTGPDYPLLRNSFGIKTGDPMNSDVIVAEKARLTIALGEHGYAFAKVGEPDLLIDHKRVEGDLTLPVEPGGKYRFGHIISNDPRFLSADHLQDISRFEPGDTFQRSDVEDLRRAILATSLVSSVTVTPRESAPPANGQPGDVALDVNMSRAPLRTIAGLVGYDSIDGFRLEGSWEHRNLFPPEGLLRLRGVAGTKEQLIGTTVRWNNFHGRDQVLTFDFYGTTINRDAYNARTVALTGTFEKLTTLIFQKPWTWSVGFELVGTNEREGDVNHIETTRQMYYVAALPVRAAYDGSDNLLDPTRGFRGALRVSPEYSIQDNGGPRAAYARIQADASYYQSLGDRVVMAGRVRLGTIPGAPIEDIAPSRRYYAGGGGSVRGYGYQEIGPRDTLNEPSGGRSLTEFSLEARVQTGIFGGAMQVVPFVDAGTVDVSTTPPFNNLQWGAGVGIRYKTTFGPLRIDVATPLNPRPSDSTVAVYVSLGQAF